MGKFILPHVAVLYIIWGFFFPRCFSYIGVVWWLNFIFAVGRMSRSSRTLYVGNLPGDIRERELEDLFYKVLPSNVLRIQLDFKCLLISCNAWFFSKKIPFKLQYGPIAHIDLKIPPRPPGYAFVEVSLKSHRMHWNLIQYLFFIRYHLLSQFEEVRDAEDAIRGRDGYDFDGHRLRVCFVFLLDVYIYIIITFHAICSFKLLCSLFAQVELAHGGRGHSSSIDRHSSHNSGSGRGPRGGVSRRSDYRGT